MSSLISDKGETIRPIKHVAASRGFELAACEISHDTQDTLSRDCPEWKPLTTTSLMPKAWAFKYPLDLGRFSP